MRDAIIEAIERTDNELNAESREMMRLTAADEKAWRHFLAAANRAQPTVAAALRAAGDPAQPSDRAVDDSLIWEVRASAVLGAITTAYRHWATTAGLPLPALVADAIDAVLPVVIAPRRAAPGAQSVDSRFI